MRQKESKLSALRSSVMAPMLYVSCQFFFKYNVFRKKKKCLGQVGDLAVFYVLKRTMKLPRSQRASKVQGVASKGRLRFRKEMGVYRLPKCLKNCWENQKHKFWKNPKTLWKSLETLGQLENQDMNKLPWKQEIAFEGHNKQVEMFLWTSFQFSLVYWTL